MWQHCAKVMHPKSAIKATGEHGLPEDELQVSNDLACCGFVDPVQV
jgi:hypothetical protein